MNIKTRVLELSIVGAASFGLYWLIKREKKKVAALKTANDRLVDNNHLFSHWLEIKNEGKSISGFFKDLGYKDIAIYGMGELANHLIDDLEGSGIHVAYGIDRDASCCVSRIGNVYSLQDELPEADVVIVTPYYAYEDIKRDLDKKVVCPILSIEDVVWSV